VALEVLEELHKAEQHFLVIQGLFHLREPLALMVQELQVVVQQTVLHEEMEATKP
jgi:hypothetical protein